MEADSKIIMSGVLQKWCNKLMEEAYDWAVEEQRTRGYTSDFLNLSFNSDWYLEGERGCYTKNGFLVKDGCIFSLFASEATKRAILRLDWPDRMIVEYHDLTNYDQLCKRAPNSVISMKRNAIRLFKYFEQNGGTYCYMDW